MKIKRHVMKIMLIFLQEHNEDVIANIFHSTLSYIVVEIIYFGNLRFYEK